MTQLISYYGQVQFYHIKLNLKVLNVLENYHMITMQNMFESYKSRIVARNPESSDRFELEDIAKYRLLIKSHLYKSFEQSLKLNLVI